MISELRGGVRVWSEETKELISGGIFEGCEKTLLVEALKDTSLDYHRSERPTEVFKAKDSRVYIKNDGYVVVVWGKDPINLPYTRESLLDFWGAIRRMWES